MQKAEGKPTTLKKALRAMPPVVQITRSPKLKELQQRVRKERERQQRHSEQLDEFWDIGPHILVKAVVALEEVHKIKKEFAEKMVKHPVAHDLTGSQ